VTVDVTVTHGVAIVTFTCDDVSLTRDKLLVSYKN